MHDKGMIGDIHYDPTDVDITGGKIENISDPVDEHGVGDKGFNDGLYMPKDLDVTTITDPAGNAAVSTAIVDAYGGVVITLTEAGNAQTLQTPTDATVIKRFLVVIKGAFDIQVNGITMTGGEAQWFIWDSASWVAVTAIDADDITFTPTGDIIATNVQTAIAEVDTEKMKRITSVDNEIARFNSTGGDVQGYTSKAPVIDDDGRADFSGGFGGDNLFLDHNVETLAANKTLVITDKVIQKLDPDGTDRDVLLPAEGDSTDLVFFIYNMGGEVGEDLYIQNDAAGALVTVGYGQMGICTCDGTTWKAIAIASISEISALSLRVKEKNTSALVIGQPVYVSGATGVAFPTVGLADCDHASKFRCKGLAAEAISQNTTGWIQTHGVLEGIDSTKGNTINPNSEDWVAGNQLWLSTTAGGITNVRPTSGRSVKIGIALTVEGTNSKILIGVFENPIQATAASGEDIVRRMGDSAGVNKVSYWDYANNEVANLDSKGNQTVRRHISQAPAAETTVGTVSAGGARTVVFSSAADCAKCKVGSTLIADGDTRIIVALPGSPNVTVDANTTWAGGTAITSLTDPISQHKDNAGNVDMYVNALGGIGLVGGVGNLQKGITFGDGDSGFYEESDDRVMYVAVGAKIFSINNGSLYSETSGGPIVRMTTLSTATVPNICANRGDPDSGLGYAAADQLSFVAGGVEAIRLSETTSKMAEKFGCVALGGVGRVAAYATKAITADATITIQVNIPSGAKILGVQMRVDAALAAGETWIAAYSGGASQNIATDEAVAQNTKVNKFFDENAATAIASAETDIAITKTGGGVFTAQGTLRAVVYYEEFTNLADV